MHSTGVSRSINLAGDCATQLMGDGVPAMTILAVETQKPFVLFRAPTDRASVDGFCCTEQ